MKELQIKVAKIVKKKGWADQSIEQKFLLLIEEVGELAKVVRKTVGMPTGIHSKMSNAGEEVADVVFLLLAVANDLNLDLETELEKKLKVINSR